jgi:hypothetical protein
MKIYEITFSSFLVIPFYSFLSRFLYGEEEKSYEKEKSFVKENKRKENTAVVSVGKKMIDKKNDR